MRGRPAAWSGRRRANIPMRSPISTRRTPWKSTWKATMRAAQVYVSQGKADRAVADFRRATELAPRNPFDVTAQADARKQIEQLSRQIPCGNASRGGAPSQGGGNATCL